MKLVLSDSKQEVKINNCSKPKMTNRRGRTWDVKPVIINGIEKNLYYDTTWGFKFYFENNGKWYKGEVLDLDMMRYKQELEVKKGTIKSE